MRKLQSTITLSITPEFKQQLTQAALEEGISLTAFIVSKLGGPAPVPRVKKGSNTTQVMITAPIYMWDLWAQNARFERSMTLNEYIVHFMTERRGYLPAHTIYNGKSLRPGDRIGNHGVVIYNGTMRHARRWIIYLENSKTYESIHKHLSTETKSKRISVPKDMLEAWKHGANCNHVTLSNYIVDMSVQPDMMSVH
tara:strand:- start:2257 stop:2844 length:588 start_codon:yes stop_codon:yes gene_type:complete